MRGCIRKWWQSAAIHRSTLVLRGHAVAQLVEALRYKPAGRGFDSRRCRGSHSGPGVDSDYNRNEYQDYLQRGGGTKAAGA